MTILYTPALPKPSPPNIPNIPNIFQYNIYQRYLNKKVPIGTRMKVKCIVFFKSILDFSKMDKNNCPFLKNVFKI